MDPGGSRKSSVSDAELFGNGSEEPPIPLKRSISGEGKKRQNQFRTSKNDKEFELEDADDVFLETGCNGNDIKKSGVGRSKSDSVLPGVVLSSSSTNSNGDLESSVHSEESPEVVPREHSLSSSRKKTENSSDGSLGEGEENQSIVGPLTAVTSKTNKPGIKRSVSFQDDLLQNRDDKSTESRRKEYRMSSGYGTGSNTSLQSQASTGTMSNYSQESEGNCTQNGGHCEQNGETCQLNGGIFEQKGKMCQLNGEICEQKGEICKLNGEICNQEGELYQLNGGIGKIFQKNGEVCQQNGESGEQNGDGKGIELIRHIHEELAKKAEETRGSGLSLMYEGDKNSVRLVRRGGGVQQGNGLSLGRVDQSLGNVDNGFVSDDEDDDDGDEREEDIGVSQNLIPAVVTSLLNQPSIEEIQGLLPILSIMDNSVISESSMADAPNSMNHNSLQREEEETQGCTSKSETKTTESNTEVPCSDEIQKKASDEHPSSDSSFQLPNFNILEPKTPNIDHVLHLISPGIPKEKLTEILQQCCKDHGPISGPGSADFKIPDHVPPSPEAPRSRPAPSTGHSSYGFSQLFSAFLKNPEIFDFDVDNLQNLLRVYSGTPPSCPIPISTEGSMVNVSCVEFASQCKDKDCSVRKCQLMKAAMIGLQHTLDGFLDIHNSPDVQSLCQSLFQHARNCEEPPMRCPVPWCYLLRGYSEEEEVTSFMVFYWIKQAFDTPVCEEDVFPNDDIESFIKLNATHHHTESTSLEVTCRIELPGHFGNVMLVAETKPILTSFDSEVSLTDQFYVIKQISNDESDFDITKIFEKLRNLEHPNLIRHFWITKYPNHINICLQYIPGDTLEAELQRRMLFDPIMVLQMMMDVLDAVDFLHSHGIIYLYWSLGNILMDSLNKRLILSNLTLSVTDDGNYDEGYTKQSLPPNLVPPELLTGVSLTQNSDCWGAACVMVHLLTGHQIWYNHRHDSRESLWDKVKLGCCPFSSEEGKIKQAILLAFLKACFRINLTERISFTDLMRRIRAAAAKGNFDLLSDNPRNS